MDGREIMKEAMKERKLTQTKLAERIGMAQNGLSMGMNREKISLGMFRRILSGMDYEVAVIDRQTGEIKWTIGE